jgi:hypothetical protein
MLLLLLFSLKIVLVNLLKFLIHKVFISPELLQVVHFPLVKPHHPNIFRVVLPSLVLRRDLLLNIRFIEILLVLLLLDFPKHLVFLS